MDAATRDQVLSLIATMKQEAKTPVQRQFSDDLAIRIITADCRPQVMVSGLRAWLWPDQAKSVQIEMEA